MQSTINNLLEVQAQIKELQKTEKSLKSELLDSVQQIEEGTQSVKTDTHKLTVTFKKTRTVNAKDLNQVWDSLSEDVKGCIVHKASLDLKKYRAAEENHIEEFSKFVTIKDAAPTVTVSEVSK